MILLIGSKYQVMGNPASLSGSQSVMAKVGRISIDGSEGQCWVITSPSGAQSAKARIGQKGQQGANFIVRSYPEETRLSAYTAGRLAQETVRAPAL